MKATISNLFRYPVKSMGGHKLDRINLTDLGIPGDRAWTLKDEERGSIKGGKRFPGLMSMQARFMAEPDSSNISPEVQITLEDGTVVSSHDPQINQILTDAIGSPVSIWPLLPKEQLDHYRRLPPEPGTDMEQALRQTFARTDDEPLPDLHLFPKELIEFESPPGTYFDSYPLLLLSRSSLATMQATTSSSVFDIRRFRPNILLDIDQSGFPEDAWSGQEARLGGARLKFEIACPRCVMATHGFADLPRDPVIMRKLVSENEGNLGIYASVIEAGEIAVGDQLELL